jgi:hypothetical protein
MNVILEGIVLLHGRRHPFIIRDTLSACMVQQPGMSQSVPPLPHAA